jgi:eukaryotic-like serine/threonine-protein kinase
MNCPSCGARVEPAASHCSSCRTVIARSSIVDGADGSETLIGTPTPTSLTWGATQGVSDATSMSRASGVLEAGQAFGSRYHIIRELGVGGMGAVYAAWDAELNVAVAIKVIRPDVMADPVASAQVERRFKRELLLARQVTHKNVVRIHDLGEIDGIKYITMTYVEGGDLASLLQREGRLPVPAVMRIARDVVSGLAEAHKAGVVHRDLKPANIMIDKAGDALIMDFGIARSSDTTAIGPATLDALMPAALRHTAAVAQATRLGVIVGTIEYMAPEQARGQDVDQRADVYALGLMLYDMLVGREHRAQHTSSAIAELQSRMEQPPPSAKTIVPDIPDAIDQLISRCLEPDPAKRYQTSEALAADLNRLDDAGVPIPEPRRFTPQMIAAAAVLVVALVTSTWWLTRTPPPEKHDPVSVVIADFQNTTSDPSLADALTLDAKRALEGASFITAYDRTRVGVFGVRPGGKLDAAGARDLALKQGLGVVLAGSIQARGGGYQIAVTASQTVTGDVITTATGYASNKDQVLPAANRLMTKVRKALGDTASESAQLFAMRSLTTGSPEVVKYYAAAVEAQAQVKMEDARQNYLKAVAVDPKFGLGYQGLAVTAWNLGQPQEATKYIQEALRHLDSMTDRERFATRGYYDKLIGDNAQCVKEYGDLLARYPADAIAHNQRAACFYNLHDMQNAVNELTQAVRMLPNHVGLKTNLAFFTVLAGQFEAAERGLNALPKTNVTLQFLAYSQVGRGLLPQATGTYQKMAAMGPAGASVAASGLGDIAIYEGRFSDAIRILDQGASADLAAKNSNKAAIKLTSVAYASLLRGRKSAAVAAADKALSDSRSMAVRFLAARVFAEAGAPDKARPLAASLSSELAAQPQAYGRIIEGLIALNSGKPRDAIRILNEVNGGLDTWFGHFDLGRAYLAADALPQADSEFDRCIVRRGEALSLMDEGPTYGYFPVVYYYQGRVREGLRTASFADVYRRYLEVRGGSTEDPLVPALRQRAGG